MKQFNLGEYLKNPSRKVITRDGRKARIICIDAESNYPIIALIKSTNGSDEYPLRYTVKGEYHPGHEHKEDLFFAPEKYEGWINVYRDTDTGTTSFGAVSYASRKEAEEVGKTDEYYVTKAKIEWEE